MSSSAEKVLLRRSISANQTANSSEDNTATTNTTTSSSITTDTVPEQRSANFATKMKMASSSTYHHNDEDSDHGGETARFGPIAETLLTTLSQDNLFLICLVGVEILGFILMVLVTCWMLQMGGFGFDKTIVFNFHPVLMTLGMIFLNANGILIYRSTRTVGYQNQKVIHFGLQTSMIAVSWIGFFAAFASHVMLDIPHFYSLHSWLGLTALIGVTISLVTSFLTFLYPKANPIYRRLSLPFHVFGGIANIALSCGICAIGITEKAIFYLNDKSDKTKVPYSLLPPVAVLLNVFGIILVIFTILVVWMVTKPEFKRKYKMSVNTPHYVLRREKNHD